MEADYGWGHRAVWAFVQKSKWREVGALINEVLESLKLSNYVSGRLWVNVWMLWSKETLSGMRLKTWSRQWVTRNLRKNSRAVFPGSLQKTSLKKMREKHLLFVPLWVVTFILFEHKVHSPCEHKVIHVVPLQPGDGLSSSNDNVRAPAPAILSSHNSPPVSWKTLRGALTVEKCSLEQLNWIYYSRAWVYYFQMEFYYFFVWRFVKSKYWFKILKILKGLSVGEWCQARI